MAFRFDKVRSFCGGRSVANPDRFQRLVEARTRVAWLLERLGEAGGRGFVVYTKISAVSTLKFGGSDAVDSGTPFGSLPSCLPFKQLWPTKMKANSGFTLIEVMSVIAIISILAAIAVPNYIDYLTKGRITEAVGALASMEVRMQQHFLDERTYVGACVAGTVAPLPANTSNFTFTCSGLGAAAYQVDATGKSSMAGFQYRITAAGKSTVALPSGWTLPSPNTCFALNKAGGC